VKAYRIRTASPHSAKRWLCAGGRESADRAQALTFPTYWQAEAYRMRETNGRPNRYVVTVPFTTHTQETNPA
jgi:hypothetical protein